MVKNAIGTWLPVERSQFENGVIRFGWGKWLDIASCIPSRSKSQVKSHGQKYALHRPDEKARLIRKHEAAKKKKIEKVSANVDVSKKPKLGAHLKKLLESSSYKSDTSKKPCKQPIDRGSLSHLLPEKELPTPLEDYLRETATGTWLPVERSQFENGVIRFGWGKWLDIASCIPSRSKSQVKSHGQKYALHRPDEKAELIRKHEAAKKKKIEKVSVKVGVPKEPKLGAQLRELLESSSYKSDTSKKPCKQPVNHDDLPHLLPEKELPTPPEEQTLSSCIVLTNIRKRQRDDQAVHERIKKKKTYSAHIQRKMMTERDHVLKIMAEEKGCSVAEVEKILTEDKLNTGVDLLSIRIHQERAKMTGAVGLLQLRSSRSERFTPLLVIPNTACVAKKMGETAKGTWLPVERSQFENGVIRFGWGKWLDIASCIPSRSKSQVKSHGQKYALHRPDEKAELIRKHEAAMKKDLTNE